MQYQHMWPWAYAVLLIIDRNKFFSSLLGDQITDATLNIDRSQVS